ncbi:TetR family transcriptional regulator [Shinella zoogloeoides]|uniref:TetR family transcriptional regulator n=1 Tax=Shinella zoogloeoides TaxID=352475 RepID=A0A6N8TFU3_SHIZO|nr:TetR family transcriptional regulator [Shinella zoogloeoides]
MATGSFEGGAVGAGSGKGKRAVAAQAAGRMTREAWVEAGVAALVEEGIANVKIQTIARRLAVSRSSFYWFFADLQDLQKELLAHWLCKNTSPILERALRPASTVTGAVCHIFECWVDPALFDPRLDAAVRSWGQVDAAIRQAVDQADDQRVEALTHMFSRYGYAAEEAFIRARVLYFTQIGHYTLGMRDDREMRLRLLRAYLLSFTGRQASDDEVEAFAALMRRVQPGD